MDKKQAIFTYLTKQRDKIEEELKVWTNMSSRTEDAVGLSSVIKKLDERLLKIGLRPVEELTNRRSAWMWQTENGSAGAQKKKFPKSTLLVLPIDIPIERGIYPVPFRRDPEWLFGEGIGSSRAGIVTAIYTLMALKSVKKLKDRQIGIFAYTDEGRGMRYSNHYLQQAAQRYDEVLVMTPGFYPGKVVDQRRGSRKYRIVIEGNSLRVGSKMKMDVMTWFMNRYEQIAALDNLEEKLSVALLDVQSERYSVLLSHRLHATICITYLNKKHADKVEKTIKEIFIAEEKEIRSNLETLEERPPLNKQKSGKKILNKIKSISEDWKLPYGVESSLLSSAAGEIPGNVPVLCGLAPASKDLYTPYEAIHRGELLQRLLLLTLYLYDE